MSSAPGEQFINSHHNIVASANSSYSGSGRFLPSIARKTNLIRERRFADGETRGNRQNVQHFSPTQYQRRVFAVSGSAGSDRHDRNNDVILNMKQRSNFDSGDHETMTTSKIRRWIHRGSCEDAGSSCHDNHEIPPESSSPISQRTWQTSPGKALVLPGEGAHRKMDRKAIARRQLVGGLNFGTPHVDKGVVTGCGARNREDIRLTRSFNYHGTGEASPAAPNEKQPKWTTSDLLRNRAIVRRTNGTDRAREALDNYNSLVQELHAEHHQNYLRQGSDHLAVLSDAGADSSGGSHKEAIDDHEQPLTSGKSNTKLSRTSSLTFTDMKFPVGIGFTRYRPLTPNLLLRLDKLKMPVKRRTQQWVNNIQESKRTLSKPSLIDATSEVEPQLRKDDGSAIIKGNGKDLKNLADQLQKPPTNDFL